MSDSGKKKKRLPFGVLLIIDLLIAGLLLLGFAYFHHGRNYLQMKKELAREQEAAQTVAPSSGPSENGLSSAFPLPGTAVSLSFAGEPEAVHPAIAAERGM